MPGALAVALPDGVSDQIGACLGIPGITAHRAVFAVGPVAGQTIVVRGVRGSVSSLAAQLARQAGAEVIGTVRTDTEIADVDPATVDHVVSLQSDPAAAIPAIAPQGVSRIMERLRCRQTPTWHAAIVSNGAVLAKYASPQSRPELPLWPMLSQT